ncbi:hypothetical protein D9756_005936 [Leucocoprinus leucothites]|uniref:Spindle pole body component n=1 Tax=Leucocoprinus leucothites TaxID=201217 RepID=A0A8H5D3U0_9AGAR|nr:hypothetical protein D9756_005936 [Leucoagaricus leucothites]
MIAELLLVLAGHSSSLFQQDASLNPAFAPLLHPGEQQAVQSLAQIAARYRHIRAACTRLSKSPSRYICALCATLRLILRDEYEALVVETEAKVLRRDPSLVATGAFVPLSSIRALFSEWDAPLAALVDLVDLLEAEKQWKPGPLIDLLLSRSRTGVHRIANILERLSSAVQRVWRSQMTAFIVHGSISPTDPLASKDYALVDGSMPSCISPQSRDSVQYVGRAVATVKAAKWQKQLPTTLASEHTNMLESVLPQDQHAFDRVIAQIRINVSEWLWMNVLTRQDIEDAVNSLGDYFLLRNGEFSLSLIREIERLKVSRLTMRSGPISMIRDQDLNLALLRASLGTTAQQDPTLARLRFSLPSGPLRPLLPSLVSPNLASSTTSDPSLFHSHLLGTPLLLSYTISWPLDLFLEQTDLTTYSTLFSFLSALRKTHTRIHTCWTSLSNAQRARRRWTGLGEGGTAEDLEARKNLLRCGWGIVRDMGWFLDTLLGYIMTDVVDVEFRRLKETLSKGVDAVTSGTQRTPGGDDYLDFTSLRTIHTAYLDRLLSGCLLNNSSLTSTIHSILESSEQFVAQVERWGGDVLPALLFEGSLGGGSEQVGILVQERRLVVSQLNQTLRHHLASFYEQLTVSTSQQPFSAGVDASKSILINASIANQSLAQGTLKNIGSAEAEARRHIERLLLRLDFNGEFSTPKAAPMREGDEEILAEGGIV